MNAPMQPDAPEWLVELLAEHEFVPDYRGSVTGNCAGCHPKPHGSIGRMGTTVHRAHVAAVVWAAITERVRAGFDVTPDYTGFRSVTEKHLLDALGADDD